MTWVVTGGAGYIGAHVVQAFRDSGTAVVVIDDLSSGRAEFVPPDVPLVQVSILDTPTVAATLREHAADGVVHLAAFKYAGVSVQRPLHTYMQNVVGTLSLLSAMEQAGVGSLVFSSSAAVYGTPDTDLVTEDTPTSPESPYGESKLIGEWLLADQARATAQSGTPLRHFNVVGSGRADLYDASPHNLFPLVLDALAEGRTPRINGEDYPTPDGTCVRDYIHVADLAQTHVAAAEVVDALERPAVGQRARSGDVGLCQVGDVDVVPDTRAVRSGVVLAVDPRGPALGERVQHQGEQVVRARVVQVGAARAHHVEVPQRGVPQRGGGLGCRVRLVGQQPLADQLALAVRGLRGGGGVLGHEVGVRCAVHGSTGGEHERAHPGLLHRGQQAERADDVLHVGVQGTLHAHPGVLEGRKMHDAVRRVLPKRRRHCRGVQDRDLDQGHVRRDELGATAGEVVDHDHGGAAVPERLDDVRADVAGAASHHPGHTRTLSTKPLTNQQNQTRVPGGRASFGGARTSRRPRSGRRGTARPGLG